MSEAGKIHSLVERLGAQRRARQAPAEIPFWLEGVSVEDFESVINALERMIQWDQEGVLNLTGEAKTDYTYLTALAVSHMVGAVDNKVAVHAKAFADLRAALGDHEKRQELRDRTQGQLDAKRDARIAALEEKMNTAQEVEALKRRVDQVEAESQALREQVGALRPDKEAGGESTPDRFDALSRAGLVSGIGAGALVGGLTQSLHWGIFGIVVGAVLGWYSEIRRLRRGHA